MKKILIILSLFFLSSSVIQPACGSLDSYDRKDCQTYKKKFNDENECCSINFIYKLYEHDVPITICQEVPKNQELKDFAKEQEEEYKKNKGYNLSYKKVICEKRSLTIE